MGHRRKLLLLKILLTILAASVLWVLLLKVTPVWYTPLMLKRSLEYRQDESFRTQKKWVSLERISPSMMKAVIASEDNRFATHNGFDIKEIRKMAEEHRTKGKRIRGCSTISQQTAKNCFTFCSNTAFRKICEAYWTVLIETFWGKERIMEVYLNVIETGKGIYGVEAAARQHFGTTASSLTAGQSALIAACLPNPLKMNAGKPSAYVNQRKNTIIRTMSQLSYPGWIGAGR